MSKMQKKMAAALAAVNSYLQDEAAQNSGTLIPKETAYAPQNSWGQSGRMEIMNLRKLIQMKAFGRCR